MPSLTGATSASGDLFIVHDVSTGTTSTLTRAEMKIAMGIATTDSPTFTGGTITGTGGAGSVSFKLGNSALSTGAGILTIGASRTGDGSSRIDLVADGVTYTTYGFRFLRNSGADGTAIFYQHGTGALQFYTQELADIIFRTNNTVRFTIGKTNGHITPGADNTQEMGSASYRWKEIFCGNATINTSDARLKTIRGGLTEAEVRAWERVQWQIYQWSEAVEEKGDAARLHSGLIAQEVMAAFEAEGLDAGRYGLLCYDKIYDNRQTYIEQAEQVTEEVEREIQQIEMVDGVATLVTKTIKERAEQFSFHPIFDADGKPVIDPTTGDQAIHAEPVMRTIQAEGPVEQVEIGDRYGLRYGECQAFEAAFQRTKLAAIEARLAALEAGK